jgi:hypothetical protein
MRSFLLLLSFLIFYHCPLLPTILLRSFAAMDGDGSIDHTDLYSMDDFLQEQ